MGQGFAFYHEAKNGYERRLSCRGITAPRCRNVCNTSRASSVLDDGSAGRSESPRLWTDHCADHLVSRSNGLNLVRGLPWISGIIHITEALMGKARLFWSSGDEDFHFGDFIKGYPTDATRDITPVPIHSHNDYWRRLPLFDAIHAGCIGVEADVWLYDEELYVGHSVASLTRNRTFRSLYVNPLVNLLEQMNPHNEFGNTTGHGVFDTDADQTLILLVDFKTEPYKLWPVVNDQLSALRNRGYLSYWNGNQTISGPITVVATGEAPFDRVIANQTYRDIFFDAPLADLNPSAEKEHKASLIDTMFHKGKHGAASVEPGVLKRGEGGQGNSGVGAQPVEGFSTANSFYASTNFDEAVGKLRRGHIDPQQMEKIRSLIADAKRRGLLARFWNTPAWPISQRQHVWHVLMKEGAGILNVDDLRSASRADWRRWRSQWG